MRLARYWDRFWFEPRETFTLGVIRSLCGFLLLCYCMLLAGHVGEWFTDSGLVPVAAAQQFTGPNHFSLLFLFPGRTAAYTVFGVLMAASITMILGLFSRASCITAFLCLLSLDHRNLVILNSGDTMLKLLVFYLCLGPTEASFSLDAVRRRKNGDDRPSSVSSFLNNLTYGPGGPLASPWAQRLIQVQISILYCSTLYDKMPGEYWRNGTALWMVYNLAEMQRYPLPEFLHTRLMLNLATWGAMTAEFFMAVLVWFRPTRLFALIFGILLHLGIEYSMNVPLFSTIMAVSYLSFLDLKGLLERFLGTPWARRTGLTRRFPPPSERKTPQTAETTNGGRPGRTVARASR